MEEDVIHNENNTYNIIIKLSLHDYVKYTTFTVKYGKCTNMNTLLERRSKRDQSSANTVGEILTLM